MKAVPYICYVQVELEQANECKTKLHKLNSKYFALLEQAEKNIYSFLVA